MIPEKDLNFILEKAVKAPSADNLQPWRFLVSGESVLFFLDEKRIQNYCDAGRLAPYLSAGAVLENMRLAAAERGYMMSREYFPEPLHPNRIAEIRFRPESVRKDPHFAALDKRCTNRRFYKAGKQIPRTILRTVSEKANQNPAYDLMWMRRDEAGYRKLAKIIGEADQLRFEIARVHREFMSILRFTDKELEKKRDGLPLASLEAGPAAPLVFPAIRSWQRMKFFNCLGMSRSFNAYARAQMLSSSAAGLLVSRGKNAEDYLRGGELMQKIWHEITMQGLALQPMEGLPVFIMNASITSSQNLSLKQKQKLNRLKESFFSLFGINNSNGLILFFRTGYAAPPSSCALRRPVCSFVEKPSAVKAA